MRDGDGDFKFYTTGRKANGWRMGSRRVGLMFDVRHVFVGESYKASIILVGVRGLRNGVETGDAK